MRRFLALSVVLLLLQACAGNPVVLPSPVEGLSSASKTKAAILAGMDRKGWRVKEEKGDKILAAISVRSHQAEVWINYSSGEIVYSYGGSTNLKCKPAKSGDGCTSIHKKYNQWVDNLNRDIVVELNKER